MAIYDAGVGKKNVSIGNYFRGDYIGLQVIKSVMNATIAFAVLIAIFVLYDFEIFMSDIYKMDLIQFGKLVMFGYLFFVLVYGFISYFIYTHRYTKAKRSLKIYYNNLKKISYLYDKEIKK